MNHNDTMIKDERRTSLEKYTSHFIVTFACERLLETEQNCNTLTPLLWPSALYLSSSPGLLNRRPRGPALLDYGFLYHILSPTCLRNYWVPRGHLRPGVAFPTTSYQQLLWSPTVWLFVLTELYNSSTPTQFWNGIFDRHQAEITVMQFTGHSLPVHQSMSVPWDFLPCPISPAKPAYAISFDYWHWNVSLPSGASLWNGMFGRVEGQNTTCFLSSNGYLKKKSKCCHFLQ